MSWLRDPETGELAKPIDETERRLLESRAGRQRQRRGWRWVVKRDTEGVAESIEFAPIPKDQKGLGCS